ncbi:transcriptional repressor TCF25-domain-containing protein [Biscogniauxia marginata]|nr:transcriptional repressor TCF25-domain-containing protein [Biscogniauxia marginata]
MSTRQLRRLQRQRELEAGQAQKAAEDSEASDDAPIQQSKPSIFSSFAALGDQLDEDDEDEDENEPVDSTTVAAAPPKQIASPKSSSKKSSKKKKKKAKKSGAPAKKDKTIARGDVDEIDQALRELGLSKKPGTSGSSDTADSVSKAYERICELLRINTYHLKVINEMRKMFGRDAIVTAENEAEEERALAQRQRRPQQQQVDLETYLQGQPGVALPDVTLRRNPFLPGKNIWPRASTEGLTMKQVRTEHETAKFGIVEFGFAHDSAYNDLEKQFFTLAQMYDPMQLVHFLHRHPYHICSLIQVSKVAKQDQNLALSADLCERALFTFGRVSSAAFRRKLEEGKARLDFKRPENRQFWLAGYHYLKSLILKGTCRTALEWSKLLFSMDPSDPYGIIHFVHPLAIRAYESKWFIDFCDSEALDECDTAQDYIRQTLVLARLQQQDIAGARALLIEGMERLPWLYSSLFKALNLDVPKAIWGMQPRDQNEEFYTEIYVHQTKGLWDNAQATSLLKEVSSVAKKPDSRPFAFPPVVGRNVGRFVYLDNTPSLMGLVPGELLNTSPNWEFDPLPPSLEENVFSYESQKLPWILDRDGPSSSRFTYDVEALWRILDRARQEGAPRDVQRVFEDALASEEAENAGAGAGDGTQRAGGAPGGFVQAFMDFLSPSNAEQGGDSIDEDDLYFYDSELDTVMPGAWAGDSEDEMPPLLPADDRHTEDNSTDDDMPPSEPAS